ncbi:TerD family protein [Streptomyces sp. NPDC085612]|uniref:TerD family protein n=1 Tax=Streptomyces sp. NPDC085612 TaxID=3365732 RepID=UPI0037D2DC96
MTGTGMAELGKGGNTGIGAERVTVELHGTGGAVDLSALLVAADGRVGSDDDMVFYNQPSTESGAVRHLPADAAGPERVEVDPAALPADVDRVVLIGSCDPDDTTRTFRDVRGLRVRAVQDGAEPVEFLPPPLTDGERAVLLVEIYRRGPGWKLRAIGQGYANGLAGLAEDFGVHVTQPAPPQAPAAPTPAPVPAPSPARVDPPGRPLGAISLDKGGRASISLDKEDRELVVTATLEWDGGSAERRKRGADLDLYALFVPASAALHGVTEPGTLAKSRHVPEGTPCPPDPPARPGPTSSTTRTSAPWPSPRSSGSTGTRASPAARRSGSYARGSRATSCSARTRRCATASAPSPTSARR